MPAKENSLVANINRRRRAGKRRPKSQSTVTRESYEQMQEGWPKSKKKTTKKAKRKVAKKNAKKTSKKKRAAKRG